MTSAGKSCFLEQGRWKDKHHLLSCVQSLDSNEVGPADAARLAQHKALGSIPITTRAGCVAHACNPILGGVQDHVQLPSEFRASLEYMRPCLKSKTK